MRTLTAALVAVTGWYAFAAPARPAILVSQEPQGDRFSWHKRVPAGKTIDVRDINGNISAEAASGAEVEVTAVKRAGRHGDPRDVRIVVEDDSDGGATICVVYPNQRNREGCDQRGSGRRHNDDWDDNDRNDTQVDFTVKVPAGVVLAANAVNGDVEAHGLGAAVSAHSVNGSVDIETSAGDASAESVNGSVHAVVRGTGTTPLRFASVNGTVDVTLPRGLDADFDASTVNGSINSDFEITVQGGFAMRRSSLRGRIGRGGRTLHMSSVNGQIRLRAAS